MYVCMLHFLLHYLWFVCLLLQLIKACVVFLALPWRRHQSVTTGLAEGIDVDPSSLVCAGIVCHVI